MKAKKKLQFFLLSFFLVMFFIFLIIFFIIGKDAPSALSTKSKSYNSLRVDNEQIYFFIDSNNNQMYDIDEELCSQCVTKQIIVEVSTKKGKELIRKEVSESSKLELNSTEVISLWGYLPEEKLVIPVYSFSPDIKDKDLYIPVLEVNYELIGENTNISGISTRTLSKNNYQIDFEFQQLIPALDSYVNTAKPIIFVYYPDESQLDNYFLATGSIKTMNGVNVVQTYWHFNQSYDTKSNIENYRFLIPAFN